MLPNRIYIDNKVERTNVKSEGLQEDIHIVLSEQVCDIYCVFHHFGFVD